MHPSKGRPLARASLPLRVPSLALFPLFFEQLHITIGLDGIQGTERLKRTSCGIKAETPVLHAADPMSILDTEDSYATAHCYNLVLVALLNEGSSFINRLNMQLDRALSEPTSS
ncbi:hypothetical protein H0G86_010500 [Trichoderma simmonsii]|uniref:Uncharacterized protein n=1 Tax=Trichoderma simmonsii TaxID=1491479 RepID=A0A8G0LPL9_9HYPO|nr:hypothetical protein H0G86_010500 [Trichoderma simmonsii]